MLVDDSSVSRALMTRWIEEAGAGEVVATAATGAQAIRALRDTAADIVVLDIEMPELDGLSALPAILAARRDLVVLMASSRTTKGAEATVEALRLGAADAIAKPQSGWVAGGAAAFREELTGKLRELSAHLPRRPRRVAVQAVEVKPVAEVVAPAREAGRVEAVLIGASTGGPHALFRLLGELPAGLPVPVVVTQHMPPMFTRIMAEHLTRHTALEAVEAEDGMPLLPGRVHIAPGGRHLRIGAGGVAVVDDAAPVNFCRPSVDVLFASGAGVWGGGCLGVVLTGMGADGLDGGRALVAAGGALVVQDAESSIVWGMPGAVAKAGLADAVLPLGDLAGEIERRLEAGR